jgi:hypothetical protein
MPVIRITEMTWDRLKQWAIPLEDTAEDALRKVLDEAEKHLGYQPRSMSSSLENTTKKMAKVRRLQRGLKTPNKTYRLPILQSLLELGGRGSVVDVLNLVEEKVNSILTDVDKEKLPSGFDKRWRNAAQWVRFALVQEGLLKSNSPNGVWELSEKGRQYLEKNTH